MAELTINADLAKETFNTRTLSDEYTSVKNKLISYQKRNKSDIKRISLVSFSNTSGSYIYDTDGAELGSKLEYDDYTSSIKAELINGRKSLTYSKKGVLRYYRPLRTVDDNLCGYIIVELEKPYEANHEKKPIPLGKSVLNKILFICLICFFILYIFDLFSYGFAFYKDSNNVPFL